MIHYTPWFIYTGSFCFVAEFSVEVKFLYWQVDKETKTPFLIGFPPKMCIFYLQIFR